MVFASTSFHAPFSQLLYFSFFLFCFFPQVSNKRVLPSWAALQKLAKELGTTQPEGVTHLLSLAPGLIDAVLEAAVQLCCTAGDKLTPVAQMLALQCYSFLVAHSTTDKGLMTQVCCLLLVSRGVSAYLQCLSNYLSVHLFVYLLVCHHIHKLASCWSVDLSSRWMHCYNCSSSHHWIVHHCSVCCWMSAQSCVAILYCLCLWLVWAV